MRWYKRDSIRERIGEAMAVLIVVGLFAGFWYLVIRSVESGKIQSLAPHDKIALAIFFGLLILAGAVETLASAVRKLKRDSFETPESKSIKELAEAVRKRSREYL